MEGKSKAFKYTMFGLLYFSQGTILSYFHCVKRTLPAG
jgi:hypothetical protein